MTLNKNETSQLSDTSLNNCTLDGLHERAATRMAVKSALEEGRLTVAYQPIVTSKTQRDISFHETLLRLVDHNGTVVPAGNFIHLVQETSLGLELDCLSLRRALQALTADLSLRLSVNMSTLSFGNEIWMDILSSACRKIPGIGHRLVIEITETAAMQNIDATHRFMENVRKLGCCFALDDFGAGATAFSHFRDFRFEVVKIDGSFISQLADNADQKFLVSSLVNIARHFEMQTVAEFVETQGQAIAAEQLGVDCLQGFLIGKPALAWRPSRQTEPIAS